MARTRVKTFTELELEIMQALWASGEAGVGEIREALKQRGRALALPSIRTMLSILQEKGYVSRRSEGRGYAYRAEVARKSAQTNILRDVIKRAFRGSAAGMVAALVDAKMLSTEDLDKVKRLIEGREKGDGK